MSDPSRSRRPAAFRLDDPHIVLANAQSSTKPPRGSVLVTPELEASPAGTVLPSVVAPRRGVRWAALFWLPIVGLVSMGIGLSVVQLVEDLFARSEGLGFFGLALAVLAGIALTAIVTREAVGLMRLATVEKLHEQAAAVMASDDRVQGHAVVQRVMSMMRRKPDLARARVAMQGHLDDVIDGADLVRLSERELLKPLDQEARRLVAGAAKRVSLVTALSPRAAVDLIFVFVSALFLIRRIATLYCGRPGTLGLLRLVRLVLAHLTMTGGLAATDSLAQQMLGHGVAAKLSARLGEGVLNGLLTARLGLAAIQVTRPLPFDALPQPTIKDLAGEVLRPRGGTEDANPLQLRRQPIDEDALPPRD